MNFPPPSAKQARVIWLAVTGLAIALLVGLLVGLIWGLGKVLQILSPVLWPIAVAGVIAYLLDPVVDFLQRHRVPRTRAIVLVFALAVMVVAGIAASVIPQLVIETRTLAGQVPDYTARVVKRVGNWINHPPAIVREYFKSRLPAVTTATNPPPDAVTNPPVPNAIPPGSTNAPEATNATGEASPPFWHSLLTEDSVKGVTTWLSHNLPKAGSWIFGQVIKATSLFGILAGLALIPVYTFYFLLEKSGIASRWQDYLPVTDSKFKEELVFVLNAINDYLISFFRGQVLVAICDGVLYTIGFTLIGLPYSVLIGVLATGLTMIPFVGAITTCSLALVIALVQFGDWQHPLLVLAVFGVVQGIEGFVIQPKIMGDRVGLHPLAIIIALMVGTTLLGGILGGILAIPLAAALRVIMFRYVWKKRTG